MAAIYMWPIDNQILLTTTLYPVDVADNFVISCVINQGTMKPIASDNIATGFDALSMYYQQIRWFYTDGPYDDEIATSQDVVSMYYNQIRWFYTDGPYDDNISTSQAVIGMYHLGILVEVDTPDESIEINIAIMNTCTMDLI